MPSRIYLCTSPTDMRNYAATVVMPSPVGADTAGGGLARVFLCITGPFQEGRSMANSLSGAWKRPGRNLGATPASRASSFSVGSARR